MDEAGAYAGVVRGWFHSPRQVVSAWPEGEVALGPRVALFVHFDRQGAVRRHVLEYLAALRDAGLSVVFVTNSGHLQADSLVALQSICACILVRRNIGYDFGAMREGLERLELPRPDTELVVIANDSVYGPLCPLDTVLARADFGTADLWGATESWQRRYHLQSFFLVAGRAAMTSKAWHEFWSGVRPVLSKHWVVSRYEVGLTQRLLRAGLRCAAIWPYQDVVGTIDAGLLSGDTAAADPFVNVRRIHASRIRHAAVERMPLNPTAELWRQLLELGFPFIKRELLRDNPAKVLDIADWRDVVRARFGADIGSIERDLQRVLSNRSP
ncbi:MAG: hypothetical protein BGP12_07540 [Rhodospirillales bacterium 70-18]|nr:MAG: hypothetical protein BGP12_07540 [Rhodospirillales bacterium 70-18]